MEVKTPMRRALFPKEAEESDSDLGPMSPLSDDSDQENSFQTVNSSAHSDYVILGSLRYDVHELKEYWENEDEANPDSHMVIEPLNKTLDDSIAASPSEKMKTPHDTSSCSINLEVHKRRSSSPIDSPESRKEKNEGKNCKARTALFVDSVPVRSFYPKVHEKEASRKEPMKIEVKFSGNKKSVSKRSGSREGKINKGVKHRVRKPKKKKLKKGDLVKLAANILSKSGLNGVLAGNRKNIVEDDEGYFRFQLEEYTPQIQPLAQHSNKAKEEKEQSPLPDQTKKFFKSSRAKATITISKNMKLEFTHGKMTLLERRNTQNESTQIQLDASDLSLEESDEQTQRDAILRALEFLDEDKENVVVESSKDKNTAESRTAKANEILSPISQMCDTTSGLALCSPKGARNLTPVLDNMQNGYMQSQKLFPIFYGPSTTGVKRKDTSAEKPGNVAKKLKPLPHNQTFLDVGQKQFGMKHCMECDLVYHQGDPEEEIRHLNYHNGVNVLKFQGWKNERIVFDNLDSRIILIKPEDPKMWWNKVKNILEIVNRELGYYELQLDTENCYAFLYIKNKQVTGCVLVEKKSVAYRRLAPNVCSEQSYPIKCSVCRIWVSGKYRRQGIASAMLDCVRANFAYGYILQKEEMAVTSPTELGNLFAQKYFKTENYLVCL